MIGGLRNSGRVEAAFGRPGKFFAALRTVLVYWPTYLHYDWNYLFFQRRRPLWTWVHGLLFLLEVSVVRYVLRRRIVWTMHNIESHDRRQPGFERFVQRRFARLCDWVRVMYPSSINRASEYLRLEPSRLRAVPFGPYDAPYPNTVSRTQARQHLELEEHAFVILHFGVMRANKGIESLVKAVHSIEWPELRLLVIGPSKPPEYGRTLAEEAGSDRRIRFVTEFVPNDEMQYYLNACDLIALPFETIENSSSVVLGMGFSRPVLAPRLGVLPEQLQHQSELLYEPATLRDALVRVRELPRERLEAYGRQNARAIRDCRWEDFAELF
jgi:beta-1,4-mannosyltransferase